MNLNALPPLKFQQVAHPRAQIWRTLLGLVLVIVIVFAVALTIINSVSKALHIDAMTLLYTPNRTGVAVNFANFIGFHIALALVLPLLHKRRYRSLFGPMRRLNWRHFRLGLLAVLAISAVTFAFLLVERFFLPLDWLPMITKNPVQPWAMWAVPFAALIFIQSMGEEVLFRGYLLQQLRARFRSPIIWALLPSLAFGALHFDQASYGMNAYLYVLNTTLTGVILSLITLRTGNLAAAIGLHFLNNAMMLILGLNGSFDAASLFVLRAPLDGPYMAYSLLLATALMVAGFALWWRWMDRKERA